MSVEPPSYQQATKGMESPEIPPGKDLNLLLVGNSDLRNMAIGNSLLGRHMFKPLPEGRYHQTGVCQASDRIIKMVKVLGFQNADCSCTRKASEFVIEVLVLEKGLCQFPQGFDAILVVFSWTNPVSREEQKAIKAIKQILGSEVFMKHGVCVLTNGDGFGSSNLGETYGDLKFQLWYREQKGFMKDFIQECGNRYVLLDNTSKGGLLQQSQLVDLVKHVDSIRTRDTRYSVESFLASQKFPDLSALKCKELVVLENLSNQIILTQDALQNVMESASDMRAQALMALRVKERVNAILYEIDRSESENLYSLRPYVEPLSGLIEEFDAEKNQGIEILNQMMQITTKTSEHIVNLVTKEDNYKDYHEWIMACLGPLLEKQNSTLTAALQNTKMPNPMDALKRIHLMKRLGSGARRVGSAVHVPVEFVSDVVFPVVAEGAGAAVELLGGVLEALLELE